ncbi:diaminopimelate epimerase-like [Liolophura sinensis]|uniref:diaminopimelate epimerase-like n=1 Tax=Liolophura sinensis TaxID=3198878 RepID=UPI003157F962
MEFSKYHGLGNNFIVVDNREMRNELSDEALVARLCDSKAGIGADGLVEIRSCKNTQHPSCAFEFVYHRSNGRVGGFCGNGGRCAVKFAVQLGLASTDEDVTFCAYDGEHVGYVDGQSGLVHLKMTDIDRGIHRVDNNNYEIYTGSCALVTYVDNLESVDVQQDGDETRKLYDFRRKEAFVKVYVRTCGKNNCEISMRSYECGVNGETLACGTGAVGAALVTVTRRSAFTEPTSVKVNVVVRLGTLTVTARRLGEKDFSDVYLIGPACHVFDGVVREIT